MSAYRCVTCLDAGCEFCEKEPFPPETWLDWCDGDLEQLAVDAIEELHRRGKVNAKMERWFAL